MSGASQHLRSKETKKAADDQQAAIDELERIWEAVIPFNPLLDKEVVDQTVIAKAMASMTKQKDAEKSNNPFEDQIDDKQDQNQKKSADRNQANREDLELGEDVMKEIQATQNRTLQRARLLAPKAQMELERLQALQSAGKSEADPSGANPQTPGPDPEQAKAGFEKAIELAPQAVEKMEAAVAAMARKDREAAADNAEDAQDILEEIQKAQPKNQQKQDQQKDDQQKQDQQKNKEDQNKNDDKRDQQDKKDEGKGDQDQQQSKEGSKQGSANIPQDRIEEALRKVRERQQEKRERDRKLKRQAYGKTPVDKDW
jgi:hypothetical protein